MNAPAIAPKLLYEADLWFGSGPGWGIDAPVLPEGWWLGAASGVTSSPEGEVFVCQRGQAADPVLVYDRNGLFLRSWGRGIVAEAHGLRRDPHGDIWLTDTTLHQIHRFAPDGKLLQSLGTRGQAGAGRSTFNMPTDLTFGPDGSVYVSDGYGNSRVVRLTSDGAYVSEWGSHGSSVGEFDTPHSIAAAPDGRLLVCDRANGRIQVFGPDGAFAEEWRPPIGQPQAITISPTGECWLANAIDSNAGRIMRLDLDTWSVLGTMESPGHMLEMSAWGELFVAALSGNIVRLAPAAGI